MATVWPGPCESGAPETSVEVWSDVALCMGMNSGVLAW